MKLLEVPENTRRTPDIPFFLFLLQINCQTALLGSKKEKLSNV
jgi:hypothetical protein